MKFGLYIITDRLVGFIEHIRNGTRSSKEPTRDLLFEITDFFKLTNNVIKKV